MTNPTVDGGNFTGNLFQTILDAHDGDKVAAGAEVAKGLMEGDPSQHKAGYSAASAALSVKQLYQLTDEQVQQIQEQLPPDPIQVTVLGTALARRHADNPYTSSDVGVIGKVEVSPNGENAILRVGRVNRNGRSWSQTEVVRLVGEEVAKLISKLTSTGTVPAHAAHVSVEPEQAIEIPGYGRKCIDTDLMLVGADEDAPVVLIAEVGAVIQVTGHGYWMVEIDAIVKDGTPTAAFPVLTPMSLDD